MFVVEKAKNNNSMLFSAFNNFKSFFVNSEWLGKIYSPCWKVYSEYLITPKKTSIFTIEDIVEFKVIVVHNKFIISLMTT